MQAAAVVSFLLMSALVVCATEEPLKLWRLLVLNRHGHRTPNHPYWALCPNDAYNSARYDVQAEDLSGLGMQEEFEFGKYMRAKFGEFIGQPFDREKVYIRAVGVARCIQSANAIAQGIFPDGFGPQGWLPGRPQFVPVFSDLDEHEYLIDDSQCWSKSLQDQIRWYKDYFDEYMKDPQTAAAVDEVIELCGAQRPADNAKMAVFVKIAVDGIVFNHDYGLTVLRGNVSPQLRASLRNLSMRFLHGRLLTTDEQKTYMSMDFPNQLYNFASTQVEPVKFRDNLRPMQKTQIYVGHREELYALADFFGFHVAVKDLAPEEVPVAASYIFEIFHQWDRVAQRNQTYVKTTLWTPKSGEYSIAIPGCASPRLCKVEELGKIIQKRNYRTGTWREICRVKLV